MGSASILGIHAVFIAGIIFVILIINILLGIQMPCICLIIENVYLI